MKKITSAVVPVLLCLLIVVIGLGAYQVVRLYNRPLADSLPLPTQQSEPVASPVVEVNPTSVPATAVKVEPVCGNTGKMLILFTGADYSRDVWPLGADSVRVIQIDFDRRKINVITFPRDLILNVSGVAPENRGEQRLGLSYYYEELATAGDDRTKSLAGMQLIAKTLLENFDLRVDHYLTLELKSIEGLLAAVGNVEIINPKAFISDYGMNFPMGVQTLTPVQVEEYIRSYNPDGDQGRIERQNLILNAFRSKLLSLGIIPQVPALIEQFNDSIVTDLSPAQFGDLACMTEKVDGSEIKFFDIVGPELVSQSSNLGLQPNIEAIKRFIQAALNTP